MRPWFIARVTHDSSDASRRQWGPQQVMVRQDMMSQTQEGMSHACCHLPVATVLRLPWQREVLLSHKGLAEYVCMYEQSGQSRWSMMVCFSEVQSWYNLMWLNLSPNCHFAHTHSYKQTHTPVSCGDLTSFRKFMIILGLGIHTLTD